MEVGSRASGIISEKNPSGWVAQVLLNGAERAVLIGDDLIAKGGFKNVARGNQVHCTVRNTPDGLQVARIHSLRTG